MNETVSQAQIDAARAYEALFVPALFAEWAPRVAHAARLQRGQRVLDVACGTGVLAREARARTGTAGTVTGLDADAGMLAVAAEIAPAIEWRQGMAESLPFPDESFDAVVSQFALLFFDRPRAVREMLRVTVPGGALAIAVWDSLENNAAYAAEVALLERSVGRAAADAVRAPYALGDRDVLGALFADAGVAAIEVRTLEGTARFPGVRTMIEADLRGWLPLMGVRLTEEQIALVLAQAEQALAAYVTAEGRLEFPTKAHVVTGRRL